ncbi:MAG: HDIG domain-containing protein [Candidatus Latescibacteria bacterium]|nr:HDIG domain-containing protein [Candidatus Latescibacterota bacterium]NIM22294.1 HDIG domain-containing protein [Candidatus Latescibacterota bacterium]NIM65773.1 HDIG domain-containing protein [Candidatus Latescibacterota bacterium]NIO02158.1 HDIG domain-containing protein [Candidatus Latescibacterota bacterium]NIO28990.1 HDIG domain-containing protein [Candidatus Latescibacterota bacterium]
MESAVKIPDRNEALALLKEYTENENLIKHALAVEAAMRSYAKRFGEDEALWGVIGLLHDFDYEKYPTAEDHPFKGAEILRSRGYDEPMIEAILSHASRTNIPRDTPLKKTLFAVDELCGLITAVALVRPSKKIAEVEVKSVKKKMKDKAFARNVSRDEIREGAALLGIELDDHIGTVLGAMKDIAEILDL